MTRRVALLVAVIAGIVLGPHALAYVVSSTYNSPDAEHPNDWWQYTFTIESGDSSVTTFRVYIGPGRYEDPAEVLTNISGPSGWSSSTGTDANGMPYVQWTVAGGAGSGTYTFEFMDNPDDNIDMIDHPGPLLGPPNQYQSTEWFYITTSLGQNYGDHVPIAPEPGTLLCLLLGVGWLAAVARRRKHV